MKISEYIIENILITDGAMGTYYSEITGDYAKPCEFANVEHPEIVREIHGNYIEAGARLIRTNTFSANSFHLKVPREKQKELLQAGYNIAREIAGPRDVFVGASIGPADHYGADKDEQAILGEYQFIVDSFMEVGADIFIFETFSRIDHLGEISKYIKQRNSEAFVMTHFAIMPDGFTREGVSIRTIGEEAKALGAIDVYGFNCGSGPSHLYKMVKDLDFGGRFISVLPNAGYPEIVNERTVYVNNPEYFAGKMADIRDLGVKILGGCCGTTPKHISEMVRRLSDKTGTGFVRPDAIIKEKESAAGVCNAFREKLQKGEFVIAVELDPPFDTSIGKIMEAAGVCHGRGVDLITIADSPMSRVRVDSIAVAAKIKREIGIDAMPHICCRDKNINAIRSGLLAAHIEGIRNVLAVTGDPVSTEERGSIQSVFNLNSFKLIELISQMNDEVFGLDTMNVGGALNLNVKNKAAEVDRMHKKTQNGATFFLTQPIYDDDTIEFLKNMKRDNIKILGGILPIVSYRNAQFLNNELPGVHIPDEYVRRFRIDMPKDEAERIGIEIAVEIAEKIMPFIDGIYFMTPFNRVGMIMQIMEEIETKGSGNAAVCNEV